MKKLVKEVQDDSDIEDGLHNDLDLEDDEVLEKLLLDVEYEDFEDEERAGELYTQVVKQIDKLSGEHMRNKWTKIQYKDENDNPSFQGSSRKDVLEWLIHTRQL